MLASRFSIAARQAATYSRGETCCRASWSGRSRRSVTDHLRHDEKSVAPRRSIRRDGVAIERRSWLVIAHRRSRIAAVLFESFDVDFIELIDIRENFRHFAGEAIECRVVEFEMR